MKEMMINGNGGNYSQSIASAQQNMAPQIKRKCLLSVAEIMAKMELFGDIQALGMNE